MKQIILWKWILVSYWLGAVNKLHYSISSWAGVGYGGNDNHICIASRFEK